MIEVSTGMKVYRYRYSYGVWEAPEAQHKPVLHGKGIDK